MDEAQWLASDDPKGMLRALREGSLVACDGKQLPVTELPLASNRKLMLWVEACRYRASPGARFSEICLDLSVSDWSSENGWGQECPLPLRANLLRDIIGNPYRPVKLPMVARWKQCRDCDGTGMRKDVSTMSLHRPLRPCSCRNGKVWDGETCLWLTPQVVALARDAYNHRHGDGTLDPVTLAAVADALEEAGADNEDLLRHLRGQEWCWSCRGEGGRWKSCDVCNPRRVSWDLWSGWVPLRGPHVRGCWAIDLLLGKS